MTARTIRTLLCLSVLLLISALSGQAQVGKKLDDAKRSVASELKVQPVDYRKLKKLLPKKLKDMEQEQLFGERTTAFGVRLSYARAEYRNKKGSITLKITDTGTVKRLASLAMTAWVTANIRRQSDDGYERTFDYRGHRAYTKYSRSKASGVIKVLVADRFLVEAEGDGVDIKQVGAALKKINIKKLARWKNAGVQKM